MNRLITLEPGTRRFIRNSIAIVFESAQMAALIVLVAFGFAVVTSFFIIEGVYT